VTKVRHTVWEVRRLVSVGVILPPKRRSYPERFYIGDGFRLLAETLGFVGAVGLAVFALIVVAG